MAITFFIAVCLIRDVSKINSIFPDLRIFVFNYSIVDLSLPAIKCQTLLNSFQLTE